MSSVFLFNSRLHQFNTQVSFAITEHWIYIIILFPFGITIIISERFSITSHFLLLLFSFISETINKHVDIEHKLIVFEPLMIIKNCLTSTVR
jgi:hypothetical protein